MITTRTLNKNDLDYPYVKGFIWLRWSMLSQFNLNNIITPILDSRVGLTKNKVTIRSIVSDIHFADVKEEISNLSSNILEKLYANA